MESFRKDAGYIVQIFSVKMIAEKNIAKRRKLFAAFMDLEKVYNKVGWNALWEVLKTCFVGGK